MKASRKLPVPSLRQQLNGGMAELRAMMKTGESPLGTGQFTVRMIEVDEPSEYDAAAVEATRAKLNVSQSVFARLVGVSDALVRSWERGSRRPAPIACRLLDQIRKHPEQFVKYVRPITRKARRST